MNDQQLADVLQAQREEIQQLALQLSQSRVELRLEKIASARLLAALNAEIKGHKEEPPQKVPTA